ncbi:MAG: alpha/beta hydrolase [Caldilineaceae bacterium]|nr:alpha/beta hydrolase [Caldilineaceae bacterium]
MSHFAHVNHIDLHYLDHAGGEPTVVLMPGLTANAHSFDGLITAGLSPAVRVLALDLRGRGLSEQPESGYTMADHAADVIGLLDHLGLEQAVIGGHSFGGLLTIYMAVHYPERMSKGIIIDAGLLHPDVFELIGPSVARLGQTWPSFDTYVAGIKAQPAFTDAWNDDILSYLEADIASTGSGDEITTRTRPETIAKAGAGVQAEPWAELIPQAAKPMLLINAPGAYGPPGAPAVQPEDQGRATADLLPDCRYVKVPGNHMTMVYGNGAQAAVQAILEFVKEE